MVGSALRLITWNTAARNGRVQRQAEALLERQPDVVTLQEVTHAAMDSMMHRLSSGGLTHTLASCASAASTAKSRQTCVLIASRFPLVALEWVDFGWPEKALGARLDLDGTKLDVFTVHMPPGANHGWFRIECFQAVHAALAKSCEHPRVLTGDFNSPLAELPSGEVICAGMRCDHEGRWVAQRSRKGHDGQRWADGENLVFTGLRAHDLRDVFRGVHGWNRTDFSIEMRWRETTTRRRFDHVFASSHLQAISCEYLHPLRESGLSDHSPLEAVLSLHPDHSHEC